MQLHTRARRLLGSGFITLFLLCLRVPVFSQEPEFISFLSETNLNWVMACSPDGKNVYAGGLYTLAAFRINAAEELETLQVLNNDYKGVKGLRSIVNLAVSPDGRFLYAVSTGNRSMLIFSRNTTTGTLTFKQALQDSVFGYSNNGFAGEQDFHSLLFSPGGKQLYWHGIVSAIVVFQRNLNTGQLTKVQVLKENDPTLGNLGISSYLAIAPDGKHLYGAVSGRHTKVMIFARHTNTGILQFQDSYETSPNYPRWEQGGIAVAKSGDAIYASNHFAKKLLVFHRNHETGELRSLQSLNEYYPSHILPSPHNEHIYLKQLGGFAIYAKGDTSERLTLKGSFSTNYDADLPAGACISPSGKAIYMTGAAGLTVLQIDSATAGLKVLQRWDNHNIGGLDRLQLPRSVVVSRNGKFVYVASSHEDSGIDVFKRNAAGGQVTFSAFYAIDYYRTGRMFASPEGRNLYLLQLGDRTKKLQVFSANETTGAVKPVQTIQDTLISDEWTETKASIVFSRDGRHAYFNDVSRILVYERNLATGALQPLQTITGRDFLLGKIYGLALSPEGDFLYTTGLTPPNMPLFAEFLLSTFARDTTTGKLSFVRKQNFGRFAPYAGLVVSPDHRHLYATLAWDGEDRNAAVFLGFTRNPDTGLFTFLTVPGYSKYTQQGGIDIVMSEDGREVYLTEGVILAMLERNPETGVLTERKLFVQNQNNVYGMSTYTKLALSPDNRHLYASAWNALGTFTTGRGNVSAVLEEETLAAIPHALVLEQNYPNPFNPSTVIRFHLPISGHATLKVFEVSGREVAKLVDGQMQAGEHAVTFDAHNLPSGLYFIKLSAGKFSQTRKAALVR